MATLKERYLRMNASGTYDIIHRETESSLVIRPDGTTVEAAITNIMTKLSAIKAVHYGTSAPSDTKILWVDTTANTGGLKYHNGSAWTYVPVAYT